MRITVIILLAVIAVGCTHSQESIKVGVMAPLSGDFVSFGNDLRDGVLDSGLQAELIFEDTVCTAQLANNAYKKLVEVDEVKYIIGPGCGSAQEVVASNAAKDDVVVILPNAAPENLYNASGGNIMQMQYSLEDESRHNARIISEKYGRVTLVYYDNAFSHAHAVTFKAVYEGSLQEIKLVDVGSDIRDSIAKMKQYNPEAVYTPDLSFFIDNGLARMKEQGINIPVYTTYVAGMDFARPLAEGSIASYPDDIPTEKSTTYWLAKTAGQYLQKSLELCGDSPECVRQNITSMADFNQIGVRQEGITDYLVTNSHLIIMQD